MGSAADLIFYPALRLARITGGPGRTPSPDQIADAMGSFNAWLDALNIKRGMVYSKTKNTYTLTPPKASYSIGRGPGADFVGDRPVKIDDANAVISTGSSKVYIPIKVLRSDEWAQLKLREFPMTFPTMMYPDFAYPNCNLWMWGIPTGSPDMEVWAWLQAAQIADPSQEISVPPGYLDCFIYNLAVRMGDQFGTTQSMSPNVFATAKQTLGAVKGMNLASPEIASADIGIATGPKADFNYMTGMP